MESEPSKVRLQKLEGDDITPDQQEWLTRFQRGVEVLIGLQSAILEAVEQGMADGVVFRGPEGVPYARATDVVDAIKVGSILDIGVPKR